MTARTSRPVNRPSQPKASARKKSSTKAASGQIGTLSERSEASGKAVLIHGFSDAGKTVLALLKAPRPVLVLDCDNGLDSVIGMTGSDDVYIWKPSNEIEYSYEDLDEYRNYIKAGDWVAPFKTIVTDNLTAAQKPFIRHALDESIGRLPPEKAALRDPDIPSQQDWGKIYRSMDQWIRDVRDGAKRRGVHAIFTAGTREWMDEEAGIERIMPNLEGQVRNQVASHMDAVVYLEVEDGDRKMYLAPTGAVITRVRLPVARHGKIPDEIEDPDFDKMMSAIKGQGGGERKKRATKKRTATTKPTKK